MLAAGPLREYTLRCPTGFGEADHGMTTGRGRSPARAAWVRSSEVEHLTFNQEVPGSIPGAPTNQISMLESLSASRGKFRELPGNIGGNRTKTIEASACKGLMSWLVQQEGNGTARETQAHNLKVVGSNPTPATTFTPPDQHTGGGFRLWPAAPDPALCPHSVQKSLDKIGARRPRYDRTRNMTSPRRRIQLQS